MNRLQDRLLAPGTRERVVRDCAGVVERQIGAARGVGGLAVRAVFAALNAFRPDFVPRAINRLLPEFASAMDALLAGGGRSPHASTAEDFSAFLSQHPEKAVAALLDVADGKVRATDNRLIQTGYARLRPLAERQVGAALPLLAERLPKWLETPS